MIKVEIIQNDRITFKRFTHNNNTLLDTPQRTQFHKAIFLEIDQGPLAGTITKWILPLHDFDVYKLTTSRTKVIDETKTNPHDGLVYLTRINFNCISPSGREWGLSIISNNPQFDEFRTFLESLL